VSPFLLTLFLAVLFFHFPVDPHFAERRQIARRALYL
jgi:hypothetical protein